MLSENRWKVILLVAASAATAEPSRALSLVYQNPRTVPMFVPRNYYKRSRQSRVLFLDEDENTQPFGRGEIDLTETNSKIKFDNSPDYEFTSPEETTKSPEDSGNDRFYESTPRFRTYPKYYQGRFGRPYAPNFGFEPYVAVPFQPAVRNGYGWKARSPRVVFPYDNSVQTNSHAGPGFDSVVFREQNFGLNDVGAEDQGLQDIGSASGADAFAERDANDSHRAQYNERTPFKRVLPPQLIKPMFVQTEKRLPYIKRYDYGYTNATVLPEFKPISDAQMTRISEILRELTSTKKVPDYSTNKKRKGKLLEQQDNVVEASIIEVVTETVIKEDRQDEKDCAQGGTCEFFFYCWMVGGLLEGSCGGLLKGCCHRVAKAGILGVHDSNSIEYSSNELSYGPVINDDSK